MFSKKILLTALCITGIALHANLEEARTEHTNFQKFMAGFGLGVAHAAAINTASFVAAKTMNISSDEAKAVTRQVVSIPIFYGSYLADCQYLKARGNGGEQEYYNRLGHIIGQVAASSVSIENGRLSVKPFDLAVALANYRLGNAVYDEAEKLFDVGSRDTYQQKEITLHQQKYTIWYQQKYTTWYEKKYAWWIALYYYKN